jgi:hypothetical protein
MNCEAVVVVGCLMKMREREDIVLCNGGKKEKKKKYEMTARERERVR